MTWSVLFRTIYQGISFLNFLLINQLYSKETYGIYAILIAGATMTYVFCSAGNNNILTKRLMQDGRISPQYLFFYLALAFVIFLILSSISLIFGLVPSPNQFIPFAVLFLIFFIFSSIVSEFFKFYKMVSASEFFKLGLYSICLITFLISEWIFKFQLDFFYVIRWSLIISLIVCLFFIWRHRDLLWGYTSNPKFKSMLGFLFVSFSSYCYGYMDIIVLSYKYQSAGIIAEYSIAYRLLALVSLPLGYLSNYMTKDVVSNSLINKEAYTLRVFSIIGFMILTFLIVMTFSLNFESLLGTSYSYAPKFLGLMFLTAILKLIFLLNILNLQYCYNGYKYSLFIILPFILGSVAINLLSFNILVDISILVFLQSVSFIFIYFSTRKSINYY